jgi:hypothetical protein
MPQKADIQPIPLQILPGSEAEFLHQLKSGLSVELAYPSHAFRSNIFLGSPSYAGDIYARCYQCEKTSYEYTWLVDETRSQQ